MQRLAVKATATTTELGQFEALAAVFGNIDRDGNRIVKGAFRDTITAWQDMGRSVPLHWAHSPDPEDIVGSVDPASMRETDEGLVVKGQLNLYGSERARQAWRAMKSGNIGLSFGYLVQRKRKAADGANELTALDVFEISLAPGPANPRTRVISMMSADADDRDRTPTQAELERELIELGIITSPTAAEQYANADPIAFGTGTNGHEAEKSYSLRGRATHPLGGADRPRVRPRPHQGARGHACAAPGRRDEVHRARARVPRADSGPELRVLKGAALLVQPPRRPGLLLHAIGGQRFVPPPVVDAALKVLHRRRRSPTGMAKDPYDLANASTPTASCRIPAGRCHALAVRAAGLTDHVRDSWHRRRSPLRLAAKGNSPLSAFPKDSRSKQGERTVANEPLNMRKTRRVHRPDPGQVVRMLTGLLPQPTASRASARSS